MILHTDPAKCKNPLVPWGRHKYIKSEWPSWVTVKNECTFLGFPVSNEESPEVTTQKLLKSLTQAEFSKWFPIGGTVYQRAAVVNSLILSRWWFNGQAVKIDPGFCRKILNQIKAYVYQKCDEMPKECVSFRSTQQGGLGLHHPGIKHKALLVKNMLRKQDRVERGKEDGKSIVDLDHGYGASVVVLGGGDENHSQDHDYVSVKDHAIFSSFSDFVGIDVDEVESPEEKSSYGYVLEKKKVEKALGSGPKTSKQIYNFLIDNIIQNNGKNIPSRSEVKWSEVTWSVAWRNHSQLHRVPPLVKERSFLIKHDMLPGLRARAHKHRARVGPHDTRCRQILNGRQCQEEEDTEHFFIYCVGVSKIFKEIRNRLLIYTNNQYKYPPVSDISFLMGDFTASPVKVKTAVWVLYICLSRIYDLKMSERDLDFVDIWNWASQDLRIANLCKVGVNLDESVFL